MEDERDATGRRALQALGVELPPPLRAPPRSLARLASAIWLAVALPFVLLAVLDGALPDPRAAASWRGLAALAVVAGCALLAFAVPPRWRIAWAGLRRRRAQWPPEPPPAGRR
jgi:uncharacterized membrane protein YbhN (UPF0104 family)